MREGKFFRIPEGPADLERLWYLSEPFNSGDLPSCLPPRNGNRYRMAGSASWPTASGRDCDRYLAEIEMLQAGGLVVALDPQSPHTCRIYVPAPVNEVVWSIGILEGDSPFRLGSPSGLTNPVLTRDNVTDIPAAFVADPFMLRTCETWSMFFEVMNGQTGRGEIGLATSRDGLQWTYEQIILAEPFHLSYPCVFWWDGEYYMIPECYQAGAVRLYRATQFPKRWALVGELMRGPYLVDATVFRHEDRWWMFVDTSPEFRHDTLRLFHAADLRGPWCEHPRSPLAEGNPWVARPAGRVQGKGNHLVRLTQTCQPHYGTTVRAFEIPKLSTTDYQEQELTGGPILGPSGVGWNAGGMHHLDAHLLEDGRWLACVDGWYCDELLRTPSAQ